MLWLTTLTTTMSVGGGGSAGSTYWLICSGDTKSRRSKISGWLQTLRNCMTKFMSEWSLFSSFDSSVEVAVAFTRFFSTS